MAFAHRRVDFKGVGVHMIEGGKGPPLMVMHGVGPGTSVEGNFARVLEPLAAEHHVIGVDLIGFGGSARKAAPPYFDFPLWFEQVQFMLDRIPGESVGLIGHSLSGALALKLAARNRRVTRVLTTGSAGRRFPVNVALEMLWTFPESKEALRAAMGSTMWDKSPLTDAFLEDRLAKLNLPGYREYFAQLFPRESRQALIDSWHIEDSELARIEARVVMIHGRDDLPLPYTATTALMAPKIPRADAYILAECGHSPAMEHPEKFLAMARLLFDAAR